MYVPRAMYSLRMSFWTVPPSRSRGMPRRSATATTMAIRMGAVALMVMEVVTLSSGRSASRTSMSSMELTGTPTRPTSPAAMGASES